MFLVFNGWISTVAASTLEIAFIENEIKNIYDINLHCIIFVLNNMAKSINQRLDDSMSYFVRELRILILVNLFEDKFHELTSRGIHC